ncbi:GntR family transcriptional regulator [Salinisphaera sp. USBA-960]|nr:GntR family transcriptional regulator [Salifodinibacter halophilus]NNC26504.1 GntR family transcriptional regulator [Salifodinibacter halophilus]
MSQNVAARPANDTASRHNGADQRIRDDIANALFDQRLKPGTRLSEARLGELYAVSRTVARKALYQLAGDKLIEMRPNQGAIVAKPSATEAREVFAARRVVESATVTACAERLTDADRTRLDNALAADEAAHQADDRRSAVQRSGDFHRTIATIAGNDVLATFLDELIGRTSLIIAAYETHGLAACSCHAHAELLEALTNGHGESASAIMTAHLHDCEQQLKLDVTDGEADLGEILG